ncbi:MAG: monooxygenase FAD-binding protein [Actinomycetia bacterium]|nr:monooxygenase FAD-binding protein [Actinomycetes bacterium]
MPPGRPRVAVIGGSLGGLITGLQLRDVGCEVDIFERSPVPLEGRGAGIVLHPVTTRYFEDHGLLDLGRVSSSARTLRYLTATGEVLLEEPIAYRFTSYATLYAALVDFFDPSRYHLGKDLVDVADGPAEIRALFADGGDRSFDLLVGADGIRSTVRGLLFPDLRPAYAGYVGWRGTLPERELPTRAREELRDLLTYHVGDRTHVLSYEIPAPDGASMNWVWYRNVPDGGELASLLTDRSGVRHDLSLPAGGVRDAHVDELRGSAAELPPAFTDLIRATREPFVQVIVDLEVPAMVRGRVCLVGDAAFALRPHIAAGTAKAAADARSLAEAIDAAGDDVPAALAAWEPAQLALGRATTARTREVGERAQVTGTFRPGDPDVAFGLYRPKDGNYAAH